MFMTHFMTITIHVCWSLQIITQPINHIKIIFIQKGNNNGRRINYILASHNRLRLFCDIYIYVKGSDKNVDQHRMDTCGKPNKQAFITVDCGNKKKSLRYFLVGEK